MICESGALTFTDANSPGMPVEGGKVCCWPITFFLYVQARYRSKISLYARQSDTKHADRRWPARFFYPAVLFGGTLVRILSQELSAGTGDFQQ